jgi:elongation factor P hydroxylase
MDIELTDKEYDAITAEVFDEVRRIYDFDYRKSVGMGEMPLPWCLCTTCGKKHQCVCSVIDMSAECAQCRFKRRVAEREEELKVAKLAYRAEQLKDFATL